MNFKADPLFLNRMSLLASTLNRFISYFEIDKDISSVYMYNAKMGGAKTIKPQKSLFGTT